ncbi:MAG: peptidoglycan DD-metalloendopeptidase family protein [Firmicutes bacterium]|nr:peptidoglycan DD-metalloendopeptidase family protein [Bacillota bacterium]
MILKIGSKGENVRKLQIQLKNLGYKIDIDGIFGKGTESAVMGFQLKNNLVTDGIVCIKTWDVLFKNEKTQIKTPKTGKKSVLEGNWKITSPFGMRMHPIKKEMIHHNGVDLSGVPLNNAVYSPVDGVVHLSNYSASAGNWIQILGNGRMYIFMHLNKNDVKVGQQVKKGQRIGGVGNTGASAGVHLHYEVRENNKPINPEPYIYFT